jgi:hypothetical protein
LSLSFLPSFRILDIYYLLCQLMLFLSHHRCSTSYLPFFLSWTLFLHMPAHSSPLHLHIPFLGDSGASFSCIWILYLPHGVHLLLPWRSRRSILFHMGSAPHLGDLSPAPCLGHSRESFLDNSGALFPFAWILCLTLVTWPSPLASGAAGSPLSPCQNPT